MGGYRDRRIKVAGPASIGYTGKQGSLLTRYKVRKRWGAGKERNRLIFKFPKKSKIGMEGLVSYVGSGVLLKRHYFTAREDKCMFSCANNTPCSTASATKELQSLWFEALLFSQSFPSKCWGSCVLCLVPSHCILHPVLSPSFSPTFTIYTRVLG